MHNLTAGIKGEEFVTALQISRWPEANCWMRTALQDVSHAKVIMDLAICTKRGTTVKLCIKFVSEEKLVWTQDRGNATGDRKAI